MTFIIIIMESSSSAQQPSSPSDQEPKLPPEIIQKIKSRHPEIFTYDDLSPELKAKSKCVDGTCTLVIPKGEKATLPNGTVIDEDGTQTFKSGLKLKPNFEKGVRKGFKFVKPDGVEMKPGETFKGSDGATFRFDPN
ncbi:hypothetical protein [Altericista sp. CCNU0014]|uniref:hypothetical protein n=1 Tax=Altericista sp. CCNU0014 TaxID=3082949 RepID=UPI00384DB4BF